MGSRVRRYRDVNCLSQNDLADKVGVSQSTISSLESDKSIPSSVMLHQIAKALGVDINDLLKDDSSSHLFQRDVLRMLASNQEKIASLIETQNKLMESLLVYNVHN